MVISKILLPGVRNFYFSSFYDSWVKDIKQSSSLYNYALNFKSSKFSIESII